MKRILPFSIALFFLSACNNPGSDRNDQKSDVEMTAPSSGTDQKSNDPDTSANNVQDSSTTMGYDTSAVRKN